MCGGVRAVTVNVRLLGLIFPFEGPMASALDSRKLDFMRYGSFAAVNRLYSSLRISSGNHRFPETTMATPALLHAWLSLPGDRCRRAGCAADSWYRLSGAGNGLLFAIVAQDLSLIHI